MQQQDENRLKEIDNELEKIQILFKEYLVGTKKTYKTWFPPGRHFDYEKMVERENKLLEERKLTKRRLQSA